jgi:hypothetical protein
MSHTVGIMVRVGALCTLLNALRVLLLGTANKFISRGLRCTPKCILTLPMP